MSNNRRKGNKIGNHATFKIYCSFIISLYKTTLQKKRSMLSEMSQQNTTFKNLPYFYDVHCSDCSRLRRKYTVALNETILSSTNLIFLKVIDSIDVS